MSIARAGVCLALLIGGPSLAEGRTIHVSCSNTSQTSFDQATAAIRRQPDEARRMFGKMLNKDTHCAVLYWGLASTAATPDERQDASLDAITTAVTDGVNREEWQLISSLPTQAAKE